MLKTRFVLAPTVNTQGIPGIKFSWIAQASAANLYSIWPALSGKVTSQMLSLLASDIALQLPQNPLNVPFTSGVV